jgi:hypothetical protein
MTTDTIEFAINVGDILDELDKLVTLHYSMYDDKPLNAESLRDRATKSVLQSRERITDLLFSGITQGD